MKDCPTDPNMTDQYGNTLIDLADDPCIISLLLKYGAKTDDVYNKHSKLIGKLSSERPPDLPLYTLITGDGGVGKSTLLKSLLTTKGFLAKLQKAKPVSGVDQKTVGIIPYEVYTKEFGKIIFFDFAGQKEFYASHCAILENAVQISPPLVLLCASLVENEEALCNSAFRWLSLVQNQCSSLKEKAHVIVVGSHADVVKDEREGVWAKRKLFADIIKKFPKFEFVEFIPMDCRFADSIHMKRARKLIQKSSCFLRSPEVISLNAHTFYVYLAESFKGHLAVTLNDVSKKVCSDLNESQEKRIQNILSFIPTTLHRLLHICNELHKRGLLMFLRNDSCEEKSFLVIDQTTLLSKVTGTVFAPESFHQHCKLASSTGVVPLSKFVDMFPSYDVDMLISFMSHLELCFEITDKLVLNCIQEIENNIIDTRFLFFPGLITIDTPNRVWEEDPSLTYHSAWIIKCSKDIDFFDPRSLQVLILRLVFFFCLAPANEIKSLNPALQKFCSVWKSGICWCNDDGITAHIELVDSKSFIVRIRSEILLPQTLALRSNIIQQVLKIVKDFSPLATVIESVIDPQEVITKFLKPVSELSLFSIKDIALAITSHKDVVKSVHRPLSLTRLLEFEPYACLDINTLQCIFSEKNEARDEKISPTFISHFADQIVDSDGKDSIRISQRSHLYRKILNLRLACKTKVNPRQDIVQALETWRSETKGTYHCLREIFNKYSIFCGRNLLVRVHSFSFVFLFIYFYYSGSS